MKSWIISLIAATVIIGLGGVLLKAYGNSEYKRGYADAQLKVEVVKEEAKKRYEQKKVEIRNLDDLKLIYRYCRWVYDLPYTECLRTIKPVP